MYLLLYKIVYIFIQKIILENRNLNIIFEDLSIDTPHVWVGIPKMYFFFFLFLCKNLNTVHRIHLLTKFQQYSSHSFGKKWL